MLQWEALSGLGDKYRQSDLKDHYEHSRINNCKTQSHEPSGSHEI